MNNVWLIFSSLGGGTGFILAVLALGRALFRWTNATEDNTRAVKANTETLVTVLEKINDHETRLAILEDREKRLA